MGAPDAKQVDEMLRFVAMRDEQASLSDHIDQSYDLFLEKLSYSELKAFLEAAAKNQYYKNSREETKSYILFKPVAFIISRHHSEKDSAKTLLTLLRRHKDTTRFFRDFFVYAHRQTLLEALFNKGRGEVLRVVKERLSEETQAARPGAYDKRLEEIIAGLLKKKKGDFMLPFRVRIFSTIQEERRADSKRLPLPPSSVDEVVFIIEEAARESYAYEFPDFQKASKYLRVVIDWYFDRPKMVHEAEFPHAQEIDLLIDDELGDLSRTLPRDVRNAETARRLWVKANRLLASKRLIEKMKVLNGEIGYAGSVVERDKEMIKTARDRSVALAVAVPLIVVTGGRAVPFLARSIGGTARGVVNTGTATAALTTRAAQHVVVAITTSATVTEAVTYLGSTAWVFYLSRAPQINQTILTGAEIGLSFTGNDAGVNSLTPDDVVHVAHQATADAYQALKLEIKTTGDEVTAVVREVKQISREVFEGDFDKGKKLFVEKAGQTAETAVIKTKKPDTAQTASPKPQRPGDLDSGQETLSREAEEWRKTTGGRPDHAERGADVSVVAPSEQATQIKSGEEPLYGPPQPSIASELKKGAMPASKAVSRKMKALTKLKTGLSNLSGIVVRLGARNGKEFSAINGFQAVRQLFKGKLSEFPRFAQHWPTERAREYVVEIQRMIINRVKRTKIAQEVATAFQENKVTAELLNKLPESLRRQIKTVVEKRWDQIRVAFWKNVYDDKALLSELEKIGLTLGGRGKSPILSVGGYDLKITLDHIARKVENPLEAFSAENLRALTSRDNSVLKEGLVRDIKQLTGLNLEDFNALGPTSEILPRELADELGKVLDALPNDDDLFRGLGW